MHYEQRHMRIFGAVKEDRRVDKVSATTAERPERQD